MADERPKKFERITTICEFPAGLAGAKLKEMGDDQTAEAITARLAAGHGDWAAPLFGLDFSALFGEGEVRPWQHVAHKVGYIAPSSAAAAQPIVEPATVPPQNHLAGKRIDIHLDRLRVYEYPGRGENSVMVTFKAQNQVAELAESVGFSECHRVREGETAADRGYPVFLGLSVGQRGTALQCSTVNVKNADDQAFVGLLESGTFQTGPSLLTTAQSAVKPFTDLLVGAAYLVFRLTASPA
jgi:hypothetical protein